MYQSDSTTPRRPRRGSATAQTTTILILGAGLTCSGVAWGSQAPPDDALDALIGRLINNAPASGAEQAGALPDVPPELQAAPRFETAPQTQADPRPAAAAIAEMPTQAAWREGERATMQTAEPFAAPRAAQAANVTPNVAPGVAPNIAPNVAPKVTPSVATHVPATDTPRPVVLPAPDSAADTQIRGALAAESIVPMAAPINTRERRKDAAARHEPARTQMAAWKPVSHDKLDELRGGFDAGGLQVSFGIDRAVYVNGSLVVSTSLTIPDIRAITAEQATRLAAAIQTATNVGAVAQSAVGSALAGAGIGTNGAPGTSSATAGSASASASAAAGQPGASSASAGLPTTVIGTATGAVSTNGLLALVQNGSGNSALAGAQGNGLANTPATIIQNSLNNQSIQNLTTISTSVNTLAAFRAQVAASTLNSVLLRSAAMR